MNAYSDAGNLLIADLVEHHHVARRIELVLRLIRGDLVKDIGDLLRPHWVRDIEAEEGDIRDELDQLLAACGLIEIFCHLDRTAGAIPRAIAFRLLPILNDHHIQTYYRKTYPIVLPQLLYRRLLHELPKAYLNASAPEATVGEALFSLVYTLDRRRLDDEDLSLFLGLVDEYWMEDGTNIAVVLDALQDQHLMSDIALADSELDPDEERSSLARALDGFDAFLRYATDLLRLLESNEGTVFASLLWLYHSYFYAGTGARVTIILSALRRIVADWARGDGGVLASEQAEKIDRLMTALADKERWLAPISSIGLAHELATLGRPTGAADREIGGHTA